MGYFFIGLFLATNIVKHCQSKHIINSLIWQLLGNKTLSRSWQAYTSKLVETVLSKEHCSLQNVLLVLQTHSHMFVVCAGILYPVNTQHSFANLGDPKFSTLISLNTLQKKKQKECEADDGLVILPIGVAHVSNLPVCFTPSCGANIQIWAFSLSKHFHLNLTIVSLNILQYVHFDGTFFCDVENILHLNYSEMSQEFCGVSSYFTVYPGTRDAKIGLNGQKFLPYLLNFVFQVMSANMVSSNKTSFMHKNNFWPKFVFEIPLVGREIYLYHLRVEKFKEVCILVKSRWFDLLVLVGPTLRSPVYPIGQGKTTPLHCLSTFQALVQVEVPKRNQVPVYNRQIFLVSSRCLNENRLVQLFSEELSAQIRTNIFCFKEKEQTCIVKIAGPSNSYAGIRISFMKHIGIPSYLCSYGGLVIYDQHRNQFVEIMTLCKKHLNFIVSYLQFPRTIFGTSSRMLLVLYRYEGLSNIETAFNTSQTTCKPILFHPCLVKEYCLSVSVSECQDFLETITHGSNLTIAPDGGFKFKGSGCGLLQISTDIMHVNNNLTDIYQESLAYKSCELRVHEDEMTNARIKIQYNISGAFYTYGFRHLFVGSTVDKVNSISQIGGTNLTRDCLRSQMPCSVHDRNSSDAVFFTIEFERILPKRTQLLLDVFQVFSEDLDGLVLFMGIHTGSWVQVSIHSKFYRLLRKYNSAGEAIIFINPELHDFSEASKHSEHVLKFEMNSDHHRHTFNRNSTSQTTIEISVNFSEVHLTHRRMNLQWTGKYTFNKDKLMTLALPGRYKEIYTRTSAKFGDVTATWIESIRLDANLSVTIFTPSKHRIFHPKYSSLSSSKGVYYFVRYFDNCFDSSLFCFGFPCFSRFCHDRVFSWKDSEQYCRKNAGDLPHIFSRGDEEELIVLLKSLETPVEALFVGNKLGRNNNEVSFIKL